MIRRYSQVARSILVTLASALVAATAVDAQVPYAPTQMVQVPIASTYVGVPAATYSSAVAGASCPSTTAGYLAANDGCPANQETLFYTYNVALDSSNDMAIANYGSGQNSSSGLAVLYQGGATMASLLTAAKPNYTFTPLAGHVYLLANASQIKAVSGVYNCGGSAANGQALDQWGDGCPAQYAASQSRAVTIDASGDILFTNVYASTSYYIGVKVIYGGGAAAASLITNYFNAHCSAWPTGIAASVVTTTNVCSQNFTPKVGYVYSLSAPGDFIQVRGINVRVDPASGAETIFATDNGTATAETGLAAATSGNQIKQFNGTGWITYVNGNRTGGPTAVQGDGGPATSAAVDLPIWTAMDQYGNLYIDDAVDARIRVIYNGGITAPLYVEGGGIVANPVVGNIYTVAGGGTARTSPALASAISLGSSIAAVGVDLAGNVYVTDTNSLTWIVYQTTGMAVNIAGAGATTAFGSASANPLAGVACNGTTSPASGPVMTDAYADGCPATEVSPIGGIGTIAVDSAGNFYMAETRVTSGATAIVRKYSLNGQFGQQAVGTASTNVIAFTPYTRTANYAATPGFSGSTDFSDAGGTNCSSLGTVVSGSTLAPVETCTFNVRFTPTLAGVRSGGVSAYLSGRLLGTAPLGGVGAGAQLAFDPATQKNIGSGLSPAGIAVDPSGGYVYVADSTSNSILYSNNGSTTSTFAAGFNKPAQIAVSGAGNSSSTVYVADSGNNRIAVVTAGGATVSTFLTAANSKSLNAPSGVAVDTMGDVFIADTGNNRVLEVFYDNGIYGRTIALPITGLNAPLGLALDAAGDLFVADSGNSRVVELSAAGIQSTVTVTPALRVPVGVGLDAAGDLFIADSGNQNVVVVPAGTTSATVISGNIAGVNGLSVDTVGNTYVSASSQTGVIALSRGITTVNYPQTNLGKTANQIFSLTNSGNQPFTFGSSLDVATDTADFSVSPSNANGCSTSGTLAAGANCNLVGQFQPQSVSANLTDVVTFPASNAANAGSAQVTLSGSSQLGLTYSFGSPGSLPNTINTTFVATLSVPTPSPALTGNITFVIGTTTKVVAVSGGNATLTIPLTAGTYNVSATYSGASYTQPVTASTTIVVVTGTSSVALSISSPTGAITYGQAVVLTATTPTGNSTATPTGTIVFSVNGVSLNPIPFASTVSTTLNLQAGNYAVSASYSGDSNYVQSSSSINFTVGRATPVLKLVPTPVVSTKGNSIGLSATLAANPTYPTGSITFSYGSTQIGSPVFLASGSASTATTTNALSSYAFKAVYSGDANYLPATVTVTPDPTLVLSAVPASLTVLQNSVGQMTVNLNSFYGYTVSSVSFACADAPAYTTCDPTPVTIAVPADQVTSVPFQIFTDVAPLAHASNSGGRDLRGMTVLLAGMLPLCCLPRLRRRGWTKLVLCLIASIGLAAASGCGSSALDASQHITPTGTYTMTINVSDGKSTYSLPYSLTVATGYLTARPN